MFNSERIAELELKVINLENKINDLERDIENSTHIRIYKGEEEYVRGGMWTLGYFRPALHKMPLNDFLKDELLPRLGLKLEYVRGTEGKVNIAEEPKKAAAKK